MDVGYVYYIKNKINGKMYIGSTKLPFYENRIKQHFYHLKRGIHCNGHLQNSYNKHGRDAFEFGLIGEFDVDELLEMEQYYIEKYNLIDDGYNIMKNTAYGQKHDRGYMSGENYKKSKYSNEQVIEIKKMYCNGVSPADISKHFNISTGSIQNIIKLKAWISIGEEYNNKIVEIINMRKLQIENMEMAIKEYAENKYKYNEYSKIKELTDYFGVDHRRFMINTINLRKSKLKKHYLKKCKICDKDFYVVNNSQKYCEKCKNK